MIEFIKALILGIVEGVTEFLPISSTGHLIILNQWFAFDELFTRMFDIVIQLGAILAAVVYFWDRLWPLNKTPAKREEVFDVWKKSLLGVLPAIVLGALFGDLIEEHLFNPVTVGIMLVIGGVFLIFTEWRGISHHISSVKEIPYSTVLLIGLVQCVAMIPGTSRSAATIVGGMLFGLSRVVAAEFSFFLAIPTMIAASAYALLKIGFSMTLQEVMVLGIGFITSFFVALLVIKAFLGYIKENSFRAFGVYRIILGIIVFLYFAGK